MKPHDLASLSRWNTSKRKTGTSFSYGAQVLYGDHRSNLTNASMPHLPSSPPAHPPPPMRPRLTQRVAGILFVQAQEGVMSFVRREPVYFRDLRSLVSIADVGPAFPSHWNQTRQLELLLFSVALCMRRPVSYDPRFPCFMHRGLDLVISTPQFEDQDQRYSNQGEDEIVANTAQARQQQPAASLPPTMTGPTILSHILSQKRVSPTPDLLYHDHQYCIELYPGFH